ncbi:MAG: isoleucine--tRNA ligase [Saprospiraceae bacterium]|nr:isoleucine--tRNA ligase [Saprospiraceae bacterium]
MYRTYNNLNLPEIDKEILEFWQQNRIFERSVEERDAKDSFVFYEGPPSANGMPGIHHVMARAVKDIFCRFHTMQGQRVERKGGWDTHGLPIELSVEKELGITKEDIGKKISVDEYNQKCRETVMRYKDVWDDLTRKMGYWVDLDNPYITYENEYIESVWWLLKQLYDKGLLYKGYTIQPYSPAAGTGLSSHELNMPGTYKEVSDTTVVAMFKALKDEKSEFLFDSENEDVRILAWTTTPWTLPSNTALTVGGKIEYVKIKTNNPYTQEPVSVVLADTLVNNWFATDPEKQKNKPIILEKSEPFPGSKLEGIRYEQLLAFGNPIEELNGATDAFRVLVGDFVTTEDGTGVVHTAPSFGGDDMKVARANGIGALTLVDKQGKFKENVGEFSNRYVKDYLNDKDYQSVDVDIAVHLKQTGKAFNVQKYVHNYPHCWRTDKPVLYYPLDSWFIKASAVKERMYELNQTINWKPASTGEGRFGKWLENLQDWNLSRSRYWGVPLPIWRSTDGAIEKCVGSVETLAAEIEKANAALGLNQSVPADLHRPYIDEIVLVADDGKTELRRELDLIDVWFDSGAMPYAQWHYPFENQEKFGQNFPADFIAEGVDQTRGWFYTLHAIATMVFDSVAFKNVVSNGLVLDKNGQKMSKRLGNAVDPFATIATYGADATRWYMISNSQPWDNLKFDMEGIAESRAKFFGKLFNTYSFFALYANVDKFEVDEQNAIPIAERPELDRWIISKLNSLIQEVTESYADYEPTRAARLIETFVDEHLSNWYVRQSRRRFWKGEMSLDKKSAYETLYECLLTISQLAAPIAPFFSDWLYKNLSGKVDSVHLTLLKKVDETVIDKALEQRMDYAQRISSLVLSLRKKEKIRVRQPLQKVLLPILDESFQTYVDSVKDLILAEVNVKEIEYVTDTAGLVNKKAKPNFKTLGKRLVKNMKAAQDAIGNWTQANIAQIEQSNHFSLNLNGENFDLTLEDVEITAEDIPGWQVATEGPLTVALDITITPELEAEGMARDIVNRIQNIRKDQDFDVTDRIVIKLQKHDAVLPAIEQFSDYIKSETLANSLDLIEGLNGGEKVELPGELELGIQVQKA